MKRTIILCICFLLLSELSSTGQTDTVSHPLDVVDTLNQDFGLFKNADVLNLSLRFDMTSYKRKKPKEDYMKATLTYHLSDKDSINKEIRLKSRGEMRNGYCDFPPIRLNFKKSDFKMADLRKITTMKLVTHCEYGNEENLLKEFLIYNLYNVLTDVSFRVRLVRMEYINTYKKSKPEISFAFFIEPLEMLAERTNTTEVTTVKITQQDIYPEIMDRVAIFNYMIGNTDWAVPNQHNVKVLTKMSFDGSNLGMIVPYDFDYSGLVNASYAVPVEEVGIKSVRELLDNCKSF